MSKREKIRVLKARVRELEGPRPSLPASFRFNPNSVTVDAPGLFVITSNIRVAGREFRTVQMVHLQPGTYPMEWALDSVRVQ